MKHKNTYYIVCIIMVITQHPFITFSLCVEEVDNYGHGHGHGGYEHGGRGHGGYEHGGHGGKGHRGGHHGGHPSDGAADGN